MLVECDNDGCDIVFYKRPSDVAKHPRHFHCPECYFEWLQTPENCSMWGVRGPNASNWQGGRRRHGDGYILVWAPDHPRADKKGYVLEHRLQYEEHLGRYLTPEEVVHHINDKRDKRDDNRIENLMLFANNAEHMAHHAELRAIRHEIMGDERILTQA